MVSNKKMNFDALGMERRDANPNFGLDLELKSLAETMSGEFES